jgi:hypothetical protein
MIRSHRYLFVFHFFHLCIEDGKTTLEMEATRLSPAPELATGN